MVVRNPADNWPAGSCLYGIGHLPWTPLYALLCPQCLTLGIGCRRATRNGEQAILDRGICLCSLQHV